MAIRIPKLFSQIGLSGSAAVIFQGTTLILTIFLSNLLGPAGLATYAVTQNTVTAISSVAQAGLALSASTFIAKYHLRDDGLARQVLIFCLITTFALGCALGGILAITSGEVASRIFGNRDLSVMILIATVTLPFAATVLTQVGVLNGLARYTSQFWSAAISSALLFAAAGGGALIGGAVGAALGFAGATILRAAILQWIVATRMPPIVEDRPRFRVVWERIGSFAIPAGLAGLSLTPSTWIASALLVNFKGLEELGIFLAALSIRSAVAFLPQQIGTTFLPYFLRLDGDVEGNEARYSNKILALMVGVAVVVSAPFALFGSEILSIFGREFSAAATMLDILLLGVVVESASLALSNRYAARERMWPVLLLYTFPKDILLVIAAYLLIPQWAGLGLAIAYLSSAIYGLLSYILIAKTQHWSLFNQGPNQNV